ncbi:PhzF family phenazine biosynthesis protein [Rhizobium aquaticum]|uniref:PhzF family phenazine biosynthesis protein n=1 Tax=Rhizobium aquaticum TaxID=1549636 RepID=A0ABV2J8V3_9HYPH
MRKYKIVDAFTSRPLLGNPVAVFLDAERLDDIQMQMIARWTNLSETTFVLPPSTEQADYRLRIFSPGGELPFAGHPTLGSAHAVLEAGLVKPRNDILVQECGVGLVEIRTSQDNGLSRLTFQLPEATMETLPTSELDELEGILGCSVRRDAAPAIVNVGAIWVVAQLESAEKVLALSPDFTRSATFERLFGVTGITVFGKYSGGDKAIEVRSFAPSCGVDEDPVCGSGNGSVAVFQARRGLFAEGNVQYLAGQGQRVGRNGEISVEVTANSIFRIGGQCVTCADGTLYF